MEAPKTNSEEDQRFDFYWEARLALESIHRVINSPVNRQRLKSKQLREQINAIIEPVIE